MPESEPTKPAPELAVLHAVREAEARGAMDEANRHWTTFVRLLWLPMKHRVPWVKKPEETQP